jgi:hypothetical protein
MEKLILVFYINIEHIASCDVNEYIHNISKNLSAKNGDDILSYFIADWGIKNRVECVNPKLVTEEEYSKAKNILQELEEQMFKYIKEQEGGLDLEVLEARIDQQLEKETPESLNEYLAEIRKNS